MAHVTRRGARSVASAGFCALLVLALALVSADPVVRAPDRLLTAGTDFTITSEVVDALGDPALLHPGAQRYLRYTVDNPLSVPITVTTIGIALDPDQPTPATCPPANLDLSDAGFSGALVVPSEGTNTVTAPISLLNTATNQDGCKNVTFRFVYTGTATYTIPTETTLASSVNPSIVGQAVTYTATVGPTLTPPAPSPAISGSVVFEDGGSPVACGVGSQAFDGMTATCVVNHPAVATHAMTAGFTSSDTYFGSSTSAVLSQVVDPVPTNTSLTTSPNPSSFGAPVTLSATVTFSDSIAIPTRTVTFYAGTDRVLGTVVITSTGVGSAEAELTVMTLPDGASVLYAVYSGDDRFLTSTSSSVNQTVSCTTYVTETLKSLVVPDGVSVCVIDPGRVIGTATVQGGGALYVLGAKIGGGLTVEPGGGLVTNDATINGGISADGASFLNLCSTGIDNGGLAVRNTASYVLIGDAGDDGAPGCGGNITTNTVNGGVELEYNSHGVQLGGNTINGGVTWTYNSGSGPGGAGTVPEIEGNHVNGFLTCTGDVGPPDSTQVTNDGQPNTVTGSRTGNMACSSPTF
jgi:hypothetical protein